MALVNPYLAFDGNCEEAFNFYKSVFGGEFLGGISRFSDMPAEHYSPGQENQVMHVMLPLGNGTSLMGSDTPGPETAGKDHNVSIAVSPDSEENARHIFNGLAAGGTVIMPMDFAPWGALFGMLIDKFGFKWMVNYDSSKK
jgi:PhnB protein